MKLRDYQEEALADLAVRFSEAQRVALIEALGGVA